MNDHDALREQAALYLVGALIEDERGRFEAHLAAGCPICEAEIAQLRPVVDALADGVIPIEPRPELRKSLLRAARGYPELAASTPAPARRRFARVPILAAAAALALCAVLGAQLMSLRGELHRVRGTADQLASALRSEQEALVKVRAELEATRDAGTLLTAQVESLEATTRVLTAPATRAVELAASGEAAGARARAFLSPDTGTLVLYAYGLPVLPEGQVYEAWVIPASGPVPAGVFAATADGAARHQATNLSGLDARVTVAVTIEPEGGLPQPSGPIVLAGK